MGSGTFLRAVQEKYGIEYFIKEVVFSGNSRKEIEAKEEEIVNEEFLKSNVFNLQLGGVSGGGRYLPIPNEFRIAKEMNHSEVKYCTDEELLEDYYHPNEYYKNYINSFTENLNMKIIGNVYHHLLPEIKEYTRWSAKRVNKHMDEILFIRETSKEFYLVNGWELNGKLDSIEHFLYFINDYPEPEVNRYLKTVAIDKYVALVLESEDGHYVERLLTWAKWCRRLKKIQANRSLSFYLEHSNFREVFDEKTIRENIYKQTEFDLPAIYRVDHDDLSLTIPEDHKEMTSSDLMFTSTAIKRELLTTLTVGLYLSEIKDCMSLKSNIQSLIERVSEIDTVC